MAVGQPSLEMAVGQPSLEMAVGQPSLKETLTSGEGFVLLYPAGRQLLLPVPK